MKSSACARHKTYIFFNIFNCLTVHLSYRSNVLQLTNIANARYHKYYTTRMHSSRMYTARSSNRLLGGVCFIACWDTPTPPALYPPRCGPGDPPNPPGKTPQPPPWVWVWRPRPTRPINLPLGCGLGDPLTPSWTEFLTHASENIALPQLRCRR